MNTIEIHPHVCHICDEQYPCTEEKCGILDKYAVCNKPECEIVWEAEDSEPHPAQCICEDCSCGDFDMNHEALPAR